MLLEDRVFVLNNLKYSLIGFRDRRNWSLRTVTKEISRKIVLLPIAPKFGTQEVNRISQSPA